MAKPPHRRKLTGQAKAAALCIGACLAACVGAQSPGPSQAADPSPRADSAQPAASTISLGTGFVVDEGYILTAWHVVQRHPRVLIGPSPAGRWVQGEIIKVDASQDLALIKAPVNMPALSFAPSAEVPIGLEVTVIGYPLPRYQGMTRKITQGLVNGVQRQAQEATDSGLFQISAEISMGNSGGPVLAPDGSVIAMVQGKLQTSKLAQPTHDSPTNVNYGLRSSVIIRFLQESPARPRIATLALQTIKRPYEVYQTLGPSVVAIIGRSATPAKPPTGSTENPAGPSP